MGFHSLSWLSFSWKTSQVCRVQGSGGGGKGASERAAIGLAISKGAKGFRGS